MAQYDVHELRTPLGGYRLVVDIQASILNHLHSRVMVPLRQRTAEKIDRLSPEIVINGTSYVLVVAELISLHQNQIGPVVSNIKDQHYAIFGALDFLFHGF